MRLCLISDLHIGNNKNNPVFHDITVKYGAWLRDNLKEKNIDTVIICGDVFHDRVSVNLTSLECAYQFFDILNEFKIHVITGNHDCAYLDNSSVHSLALLKKWSNITVYDKPTPWEDFFFAPWGTTLDEMVPAKYLIAHLELNGYEMSKHKICTRGDNASDIMQKYQMCFTGHFHKPQGRKYDNKLLLYTGSCFQLNWGESGEEKFYYILDTDTNKLQKFKNTVSPKFHYIYSEADFDKIENNFVSVQITDDDQALLTKVNLYKPLDIKTQLMEGRSAQVTADIKEFKIIEVNEIIKEVVATNFVNLLEEEKQEVIGMLELLHKDCSQIV